MGIRESLLNTITSVADSDFVRIVTSAGASSKATVQNLFKGFESNLGAKSSLTTSDYIRVVGSDNEAYKQLVSDVAKKIIEDYTGSSLAGSSQSVKSALDTLNSNTIKTSTTLTKSTSVDNFEYYTYKYGSLFTGYIIFRASNDIADNGEIVSAGVPTLIGAIQLPITCVAGTQAGQTGRCRISTGKIISWYTNMPLKAGNTYLIQVNAICA